MYLSWTDDVPVVYPPYTCATGNVQDECPTLMGFHVGGPTRPIAHIALSTTAPGSAYKNTAPLSNHSITELQELQDWSGLEWQRAAPVRLASARGGIAR